MGSTAGQIVIAEKVSKPAIHALVRPRVTDRIGELIRSGVGYVHGAAGIGKTTALVQLADRWPGPTAWIRLDHGDADESRLVALLESALDLSPSGPDPTIDRVIAELDSPDRSSTLVVFDDLHSIEGSPAEQAIHRLVRYRPPHTAVLMGSRHEFDLALRALLGSFEPMVIDFEDLRFRLWEVDDLMRSHHDLVIAPADLPLLCRYTDGWAAALRLFWVASRDAAPEHRSHLISGLRTSSGMVHDYLMNEVLSSLDPAARRFLVTTAVFEQITPERANALLDSDDARAVLRSIQAVGLFGEVAEATDTFRCHDLLRTHLLGQLTELVGADEALALQLRAAVLAESGNAPAEAIRYYARGGDFDSVRRILDSSGEILSTEPGRWIDVLPPAMREQDAFVLLTSARHLVRHGDLDEARIRYRRAIDLLGSTDSASRAARDELRLLGAWLLGEPAPALGWVGNIRDMLRAGVPKLRRSGVELNGMDRGVADFLAGDLAAAAVSFRDAEETQSGLTAVIAGSARLLVDHFRGGDEACSPVALRRVQQAAKSLDARVVERLVGAISRGGVAGGADDPLSEECRQSGDRLGGGLVHLIDGVALIHEQRPDPDPFCLAAATFAAGEYDELALLARCFEAATSAALGYPTPDHGALEKSARRSGGVAQLLMLVASASAADGDVDLDSQIDRLARRSDLTLLVSGLRMVAAPSTAVDAKPATVVRVLGSFAISVAGQSTTPDLTPLHTELLACLAAGAGEHVHADRLMASFWPGKDDTRARRSLQVAISKVRLEIERLGIGTLERDGSRYSLVPASTTTIDILSLRGLLATPAVPLADRADAIEAAMESYGELVEDLGALNWVVESRRELRLAVSRAALQVAVALYDVGDESRAGRVAAAGVQIDSGADELWQLAIAHSGAARSGELQAEYNRVIDSYQGADEA